MQNKKIIGPIVVILITAIFLVHHNLIYWLMRQDYRTYLFIFDFIYKKTFEATQSFALWQNYSMCGISYIVNFPSLFSISRVLTLIGFSSAFALAISDYIFMTTGAISFFLLMRLYKCSQYVSLFGAMIFEFFLYKLGNEGYPLALASLILLICERYDKIPNFLYIAGGAIAIGITCFSGISQGLMFILIFQCLLIGFYWLNKMKKRYCIASISSWVLGIILSLPILLPQMRDALNSQRLFFERYQISSSTFNFYEFIDKLKDILYIQYFFPVSLIIYILAISSIFYLKGKQMLGFYLVSLFMLFFYTFFSFTQGLWENFPMLGKYIVAFDLNRMMLPIWFSIIFLATYTINSLVNKPLSIAYQNQRSLISITSLLMAIFFTYLTYLSISKYRILVAIMLGAGVFLFIAMNLFLRSGILKKVNLVFFILFLCLLAIRILPGYFGAGRDLVRKRNLPLVKTFLFERYIADYMDLLPGEAAGKKFEILSTLKKSSSSEYFRTVDIGDDKIYHEYKFLANQIYTPFGLANIYPARYHGFFKWLIDDLRTKSPEKYETFATWGASASGMGSSYNENLLSLAGVKWILANKEIEDRRFKKILNGNKYTLYLNDKVLPRAFSVFRLNVLKDKKEMADFMMSASANDFRQVVPILAQDAQDLPKNFINKEGRAVAKIIRYNPNEVLIESDFKEDGLLVLTDNLHSSWKATIDGIYSSIYPAYYTFRMVEVPKGKHLVRFFFIDKLFFYSLSIALITLMGIILAVIFMKTKPAFNLFLKDG